MGVLLYSILAGIAGLALAKNLVRVPGAQKQATLPARRPIIRTTTDSDRDHIYERASIVEKEFMHNYPARTWATAISVVAGPGRERATKTAGGYRPTPDPLWGRREQP
jgi:hypothetical protein